MEGIPGRKKNRVTNRKNGMNFNLSLIFDLLFMVLLKIKTFMDDLSVKV